MKLHLAGTANRRTAEYRTAEFRRMVSFDSVFFCKIDKYLPSTFDIHYSIFDIRFFKVSCSIKLAAPAASG